MSGRVTGFLALMAWLAVFWIVASQFGNPEMGEPAKKAGKEIVVAIERYKEDNKCLPGDLNDLVPRYFASIPGTSSGLVWNYDRYMGDYYLSCNLTSQNLKVYYHSDFKGWGLSPIR